MSDRSKRTMGLVACLLLLGACSPGERSAEKGAAAVAITGATVIPMTGEGSLEDATVLIRGDRIEAVGPAGEVEVPEDARVVDGEGKFLIPGLIEMHAHLSKTRASAMGLLVADGVTTVRDMGGDHRELLEWRREVRASERLGPRILMAGPYLESARNVERMAQDPPEARIEPFRRTRVPVGSPEAARRIVDSLAALELDFLKVRTVESRETYRALNEAADAHGLKLVGHVTGLPPELILEAGQDGVEHFLYPTLDSLSREERMAIWERFAARGIAVVPTLVTFTEVEFAPLERLRAVVEDSLGRVEPRRRYLSRFLVLDWREQLAERADREDPETAALFRGIFVSSLRNFREMHEAGADLLVGSDVAVLGIFPGSSLRAEMGLFQDSLGMTPTEVLERTTRLSAGFLGIADSVGTIEPGKVADLVLLDADPLADVRGVGEVAGVALRGRWLGPDDLARVRAEVEAAPDRRVNDWPRER